jgi:hypothetical protein
VRLGPTHRAEEVVHRRRRALGSSRVATLVHACRRIRGDIRADVAATADVMSRPKNHPARSEVRESEPISASLDEPYASDSS